MFDAAGVETYVDTYAADSVTGETEAAPAKEFIFVDENIDDASAFTSPDGQVKTFILNKSAPAFQQIAEKLDGSANVLAIHILSHGKTGAVEFASGRVDSENIKLHSAELKKIGDSLAANGDILLYGCSIGRGEDGADFLAALARAADADVAASNDQTGSRDLGGDWALESVIGTVEAKIPFVRSALDKYGHVLAAADESFDARASVSLVSSASTTVGSFVYFANGATTLGIASGAEQPGHLNQQSSGDRAFQWAFTGTIGVNEFGFRSADGSEFSLESVDFANTRGGFLVHVAAYRDGSSVAWDSIDLSTSDSEKGIHYEVKGSGFVASNDISYHGTMSFVTGFKNIDEVRFAFEAGDVGAEIDNIEVSAPGLNVAPVISGIERNAVRYIEGDGPQLLTQLMPATVTDSDSVTFSSGELRVAVANAMGSEILGIENQGSGPGQIDVVGTSVRYQGTPIGSLTTDGQSGSSLVITFNANADATATAALVNAITYANNSQNPTGSRAVGFTLSDGDGGTSTTHNMTVTMVPVNDAPMLSDASVRLTQITEDQEINNGDSVADIVINGSVSDPDGNVVESIAVIEVDDENGEWQYSTDGGGTWTSFGAVTAAQARLLDATARIRYVPDLNYSGLAAFTFRAWDQSTGSNGGTANTVTNGSATAFSVATDTAVISVSSVNDAPILSAEFNTQPFDSLIPRRVFNSVSVIDVDDGETDLTVRIRLSNDSIGSMSLIGGALDFAGFDNYSLSGLTPAEATQALSSLMFVPAGFASGQNTTITISVDDQTAAKAPTVSTFWSIPAGLLPPQEDISMDYLVPNMPYSPSLPPREVENPLDRIAPIPTPPPPVTAPNLVPVEIPSLFGRPPQAGSAPEAPTVPTTPSAAGPVSSPEAPTLPQPQTSPPGPSAGGTSPETFSPGAGSTPGAGPVRGVAESGFIITRPSNDVGVFSGGVASSSGSVIVNAVGSLSPSRDASGRFSAALPVGTFQVDGTVLALDIRATLEDGVPLPAWLSFDSATGTFVGEPPPGSVGTITVVVTVFTTSGESAAVTVELDYGSNNLERPDGSTDQEDPDAAFLDDGGVKFPSSQEVVVAGKPAFSELVKAASRTVYISNLGLLSIAEAIIEANDIISEVENREEPDTT